MYYYLDTEPPVFTDCPNDVMHDDITTTEKRIDWQRPTVTDNSGYPPSVSSNRQSGYLFFVPGSYEVLYTATDAAGNVAKTCSFRITLKRKYTAYIKKRLHCYRVRIRSAWTLWHVTSVSINQMRDQIARRIATRPRVAFSLQIIHRLFSFRTVKTKWKFDLLGKNRG